MALNPGPPRFLGVCRRLLVFDLARRSLDLVKGTIGFLRKVKLSSLLPLEALKLNAPADRRSPDRGDVRSLQALQQL